MERLQTLERTVHELRSTTIESTASAFPEPQPALRVDETSDSPPDEPLPVVQLAPELPQSAHRVRRRPPPVATNWAAVEAFIGGRGLGWAAMVLLIFAVGFFLKHVFERNLIGELGRVSIGIAIGCGLTIAGYGHHRRGWRVFGQMLTAGGVAVLYLSTFASFGYYRLLDQQPASVFLTALVAEAFLLAVLYDAPAIALMAVLGGLLAPVLLHSDVDRHRSLFAYLAVLDAGVVALILCRRWWAIATVALAGTHLLFWLWYFEHYHPAKLAICLVFHGVVFTLFVGQGLLSHVVQRQRANLEDLGRLLFNALMIAVAGYLLLDDKHHHWLGTLSLGMAIVFTLQVWLAERSGTADRVYEFALFAVAMSFLAMVFPVEADRVWIAVGWAAQGLTLWWFGVRIGSLPLRGLGAALLVLATGRLLIVDTILDGAHWAPFVPIFNKYGLPALAIAASFIAAALIVRRIHPVYGSLDFASMRVLGLAGVGLAWIVLSIEAYDYFVMQIDQAPGTQLLAGVPEREMEPQRWEAYRAEREDDLRYTAQVAMSVVWAVYAALVLAVGFRLDHRPLRGAALGLFVLTLGKVVFEDMGRLPGFYRVAAFLVLSLMMAAAAWAYQKLTHRSEPV